GGIFYRAEDCALRGLRARRRSAQGEAQQANKYSDVAGIAHHTHLSGDFHFRLRCEGVGRDTRIECAAGSYTRSELIVEHALSIWVPTPEGKRLRDVVGVDQRKVTTM